MSEVKWIKITTTMFDDEKIKLIRKMPESDALLLTWVQLLVQAGKANASGSIVLNEKIPYTDEMLSAIFDRPLNTVRLALQTFHQLEMIDIENGVISISNWDKHQNMDALEKIREKERNRKRKQRELKKQQELPCPVTVPGQSADSSISISNSLSVSNSLSNKEKEKKKKIKVAEFVSLTEEEHQSLIKKLGEDKTVDMIENLNLWKGSKGKKTKSDYLTILNWVKREEKEKKSNENNRTSSADLYAGKDFGF